MKKTEEQKEQLSHRIRYLERHYDTLTIEEKEELENTPTYKEERTKQAINSLSKEKVENGILNLFNSFLENIKK